MAHVDYLIMGVYLGLVLVIGWFAKRRMQRDEDLFLAGRSMGWLPIGLSVMVTAFSVVNYMALPTEVLANGSYVLISLPVFFLAAFVVSRFWLPVLFSKRLSSLYEYLELRYDARVRALAGVVFILWRMAWMATALYAAGMLLSKISNLDIYLVIVLAGLVATLYTGLGGMRAVMWTDCLQFFVLFGGILLGLILFMQAVGWEDFLRIASSGGRFKPFYPFDPGFFSLDPGVRISFYSGVMGVTVAFLSRYGADQVIVQRYLSARGIEEARRGIWLNAVAAFLALSFLAAFGALVYVQAVQHGELQGVTFTQLPLPQRKALALREFIQAIKMLPAGVFGLVISGLLAATMSSIDSGINACSSSWVSDVAPGCKRESGDDRVKSLGWVYVFGLSSTMLGVLLVPLVGYARSIFVIANQIINALGSPLLALFLVGLILKRSNASGAFWGGLLGFVFSVWFSLCYQGLALHYYAVVNLLVTCLLIWGLSVICSFRKFAIDK